MVTYFALRLRLTRAVEIKSERGATLRRPVSHAAASLSTAECKLASRRITKGFATQLTSDVAFWPIATDEALGRSSSDRSNNGHAVDVSATQITLNGSRVAWGLGPIRAARIAIIGFEGRFDCAVVGPVANVVSRLCDKAKPKQILISEH
jgi:class 3 adenylate cyclase